jgi:hypothetical protein
MSVMLQILFNLIGTVKMPAVIFNRLLGVFNRFADSFRLFCRGF